MEKNHSLQLIAELEDRVHLLIKKYSESELLCIELLEKNKLLNKKIQELQFKIEELEREKTIRYLHALTDEQQKEQLKRYLDALIKNLEENIQLLK